MRCLVICLLSFIMAGNAYANSADDLEARVQWWESRAFTCQSNSGAFPSKEGDGAAPACDDGDSIMFNSLLCRSGDERGCDAVRRSQDGDGRFWRSPKKRDQRPAEPNGMEGGQTTFSGDHAKGLMLYFGHTADRGAFAKWIKWIELNPTCKDPPHLCVAGTPRYCENDRCAFRPGDCQIILLLGQRMNVPIPFCGAVPIVPVLSVSQVIRELKAQYDRVSAKGVPIVSSPARKLLSDKFDDLVKNIERAEDPLMRLKTQLEAALLRQTSISQLAETISIAVNSRGFSRHNAVVTAMMLQDWGLGKPWMSDAVERVAAEEPLNPFFQYVAHRRGTKASMLPLILDECPAKEQDPLNPRTQWSWERDTAKREWVKRMYWDCLFITSMFKDQSTTPADDSFVEDSLTRALNELVKRTQLHADEAKNVLKELAAIGVTSTDPIDAGKKLIETEVERHKNILRDTTKPVRDLGKAANGLTK